ncbi:MAG: hypothetical protein ACREXT_05555, partial [Gammaproteobacteria bacterium]
MVVDFNGNNIQGSRSHAVNIFADANAPFTKTISGRIRNNIIGTAGVTGSAAQLGFPVRVQNEGRVPITLAITNNTIRESLNFTAINVNHGISVTAGTAATNVTITGNTITDVDSGRGVLVQQVDHTTAGLNAGTLCADISGNTFANIVGQAGDGTIIRVREASNTAIGPLNVRQLTPTAAVNVNELDDANAITVAQISLSGAPTFNAGICTQPSNFAPPAEEEANILTGDSNTNLSLLNVSYQSPSKLMVWSQSQAIYGDAQAVNGDPRATYGDARAAYGDARAAYGDAQATYGDARATYGESSATYDDKSAAFGYKFAAFVAKLGDMISPTVTAQGQRPPKDGAQNVAPESGETVTKTLGTLPAGESITVKFRATVDNGPYASGVNAITNTANVTAAGGINVNSNTSSINLDAAPDLVVTKTEGGGTTQPGVAAVYTLSYSNTTAANGQNAANVVLTETVPANTTFNAAASLPSVWSCANGSAAGTSCTINIGAVNAGAAAGTATFAVNVLAALPAGVTQVSNTSSIAENPNVNGTDRVPANNTGPDTTNIIGNWLGTTNTDWFAATNWSNGVVPPTGNNVSIPTTGNVPTVTGSDVTLNNMVLNGQNASIGTGRTITVNGAVTLGANNILG